MKNNKRYLSFILCTVLLFVFISCNKNTNNWLAPATGTETPEQSTNQSVPTQNPSTPIDPPDPTTPITPTTPTPPDPPDPPKPPDDNPRPQTPFITLSNVPLAVNKGDLILVNRDHTFDASLAATDLVLIKKAITDPVLAAEIVLAKYEMYLTAKTVDALAHLSHDMQTTLSSNKNIHIYSAYRDNAYQQSIIDDYLSRPGYGQSYVDNYVAPVGASEHHTGMAVDINFYADNGGTYRFDDPAVAAEYAWLLEHAHEYGLIWRYTDEKKDLTGYSEEIYEVDEIGAEDEVPAAEPEVVTPEIVEFGEE